jgi:hemolysin type calcium-binding protein
LVLALVTVALSALFAVASTAHARPGDVIVGDSSNAKVFRLKPATGAKTVISDDPKLVSPSDSVFGPNGALYVSDYGANGGTGAVFKINTRTGATTTLAGGAPFVQPDGIARGPNGDLFATDLDAEPSGGNAGALFRVDARSGGVKLVSSVADGAALAGPVGVVVPPNGKPIVATFTPSIVQVNPRTGAQHVIASAADGLTEAGGLARAPDGTLYTAGSSGIDSVNPRTGHVRHVSSAPADGYGMAIDFHGDVLSQTSSDVLLANPRTGNFKTIGQGFGYAEGFEVQPPRCGGRTATIVGTTRRDTLPGSKFADVIAGLDGKDVIKGKPGNDLICAGAGNDVIRDTRGKNKVDCGPGHDVVTTNRRSKVAKNCEDVTRR